MKKPILHKALYYIFLTTICSFQAKGQNLYFPPISSTEWQSTDPAELGWCAEPIDSLYHYLQSENTKAFIVLKDGKIVLEKYFGSFTADSVWYWASAGKSLTAVLVGIAQQKNLLSLSDPSSKYLGKGWTSLPPAKEDLITIKNQLSMTTGLDDGVSDPYCTLPSCLQYKADAGTRWAYHNGPYTLLDEVISKATGQNINVFNYNNLQLKTGIAGTYIKVGYNNIFFSKARSMARFGLLVLNKGYWGNTAVLEDSNYYKAMIRSSQNINPSYGYLWWLNGQESYMVPQSQLVFNGSLMPDAPQNMVCAMGKNGQFIDVVPDENLVLVRMGNAPERVEVPFLMNNEIWKYMNRLNCTNTGKTEAQALIEIYPNPAENVLTVHSQNEIIQVQMINAQGELVRNITISAQSTQLQLNIADLPKGIYWLMVVSDEGVYYKCVVK